MPESDQLKVLGTPAQQALQQAVARYYAGDPRILAVVIFGSLGRGDWDEYSDLDLDVVLADDITFDVLTEVERLCESLGAIDERPLLIIPDGEDASDVVLASLRGFSIRYHALSTSSPNIVDSLRILTGSLGPEVIRDAGIANRTAAMPSLRYSMDRIVRWTIDVDKSLRRGNFWQAAWILQRMRELVITIFMLTHGGNRPYHTFNDQASSELQARLGATLHRYSRADIQTAFASMLDLIENDLDRLGEGQVTLSPSQAEVITRVRQRLSQADEVH